MPNDATWDDYVAVYGGPNASGWWITLDWFGDSEHPRPEVVGPYTSQQQAVDAMQDSLLIDGFAEDSGRDEWLDDVHVDPAAVSIARMCATYGHRVTLIDPGDPNHFGREFGPSSATGPHDVGDPAGDARRARSGRLQAGALHSPGPETSRPATREATESPGHSPGPPAR